ncbi:MAG: hypothetical protein ABIB79_00620 [archaeon]
MQNFTEPPRKNGGILLVCDNCGLSVELGKGLVSTEKIKAKERIGGGVVDEENILATYNHICKKCGYTKAQILDLGISYSDEDNLILLKCGKCGWSERIGRKTS